MSKKWVGVKRGWWWGAYLKKNNFLVGNLLEREVNEVGGGGGGDLNRAFKAVYNSSPSLDWLTSTMVSK